MLGYLKASLLGLLGGLLGILVLRRGVLVLLLGLHEAGLLLGEGGLGGSGLGLASGTARPPAAGAEDQGEAAAKTHSQATR